jgi:hypothetical protein
MKMRSVESTLSGIALAVLAATTIAATAARAAEDTNTNVNEVRQYALALDTAQKAATAMQSINQLVASNPALNGAMQTNSDATGKETITQQAQTIDSKYPQVAAIIRQNGLQTREFIVITGAIINDVGWVGMKKQGMVKQYPPGMITPQNAALIEGNWDTFQQIAAKMMPPHSN